MPEGHVLTFVDISINQIIIYYENFLTVETLPILLNYTFIEWQEYVKHRYVELYYVDQLRSYTKLIGGTP